ncbi:MULTISPECIES: replicative DNA helicase [Slackia]|uniref:Replicative DNA helicase n=1 Tax=Slackia exigua (strain ATCC 700122 / DSM 15923 / CIP 105133 / JCM 11022 / KCTC 5966 / S-7) TaxID=649764 RepID=D0WHD8_SLAES|nr:replicative DNA helicase [Slackia exigua ATCC 700122]EJU34510.1 replicative DNA helicase [Slackia sp. CM382]MCK6138461.1 replicative DNA helicase [Slackia exigua]STN99407.1 Replicative DNA helicase [Slackia exigua]
METMPNYQDPSASIMQSTTGRPLPSNVEAEKSVLAACMLNEEAVDEIASSLSPENFYRPAHRLIFEGIANLASRHIPIDQISLADRLAAEGQLEAAGGRPYLVELANNTLSLTNWKSHSEIVRRASLQRDLIYASTNINALAYDAPDDASQTIEEAERMLFSVTQKRVGSSFTKVGDLLSTVFDQIDELARHKDELAGVGTGFKDVDDLFWGWRGGDLLILAARPAVGKTSFALNVAVNAAKHGASVALFSLEMSATQLVQRILCSEARVNLSKLRTGSLTDADWAPILSATDSLSKLDLWIDDTPGLSLLEMRAKARRQLRDKERGLIIVDYLQLMQPTKARRDGNRSVEVAEISRGLKVLAKELDVPILSLSQLSRAVEMRGNKRPMLSDLRESGSIEQDADIVMFIDRSTDEAEAEQDGRPPLGTADLIVAKHRNGATRDIRLSFAAEYTKFGDYVDVSMI